MINFVIDNLTYLFAFWGFVCFPVALYAYQVGKTLNKFKIILEDFEGSTENELWRFAFEHPMIDIFEIDHFCDYAKRKMK